MHDQLVTICCPSSPSISLSSSSFVGLSTFYLAEAPGNSKFAGQENAADVSLEVLKALPSLQERDQSRGRFGSGGRGGFGDRNGGGGRFSFGRGGRRNDRFSGRPNSSRGRSNNKW